MDLSGERMAVELHALADSLSEEIDKLDCGDLDVQAQRMAKNLEDKISKLAHKRFSSVAEKPHYFATELKVGSQLYQLDLVARGRKLEPCSLGLSEESDDFTAIHGT